MVVDKEKKEFARSALIEMHSKILAQFRVLENYYGEDKGEPIRAVLALKKTINECFISKIEHLRGE